MQAKLIGHQHRDTVIHHLSGAGKLLFFILVSLAAMISYDTRLLCSDCHLFGISPLFVRDPL